MRVLVTGASGLIGSALCDALLARGDEVVGLSRDPASAPARQPDVSWHAWDPTIERPPEAAFEGVDAVVNLIGENINQRLTDEAKRADPGGRRAGHQEPRRRDARGLAGACDAGQPVGDRLLRRPRRGDRRRVDPAGGGLPRAARRRAGRRAAHAAEAPASGWPSFAPGFCSTPRAACSSSSCSRSSSAWAGRSRRRPVHAWIHRDDEVGLILWALDNPKVDGVLNATAPNPVTNRELSKALGRALHRPAVMPVPRLALVALRGAELTEQIVGATG